MAGKYEGVERRNGSWHLDKTISIGHILTTLTVAGSLVVWGLTVDKRVAVLEAAAVYNTEAHKRMDDTLKESVARIEAAVVRMEAALRDKADKR